MNVAFLHPDLGVGGAERLVVDAASELRAQGHCVVLLTARPRACVSRDDRPLPRDGETGCLCAPRPDAFASALARLLSDGALGVRLGREGRRHVAAHFSRAAFGRRLEEVLRVLVERPCSPR